MTPAINAAKKSKITFRVHTYDHEPGEASYGMEAARKLNLDPDRVFKTLVVSTDSGSLAVAIVPVSRQLDLKAMAQALGAKKTAMAAKPDVQRSTGYVLGGVSPLGQKRKLPTVVDSTAEPLETLFVSAGKRGIDMELSPEDLVRLTRGKYAPISRS